MVRKDISFLTPSYSAVRCAELVEDESLLQDLDAPARHLAEIKIDREFEKMVQSTLPYKAIGLYG